MNAARFLLVIAISTVALSLRAQDFLPIPFPSPHYELDGFAVMPPTGARWLVKTGATRVKVQFLRSTEAGRHHTVLAWAESFEWPRAADSVDDIVRQIAAAETQPYKEPSRYSNVRVDVIGSHSTDLSCGEFLFSVEDRGVPYAPGELFIIQGWEMYCLHPKSPTPLVLKLAHSQRFLQGTEKLPLDSELKMFREGVKVQPVSTTGETANTSSQARRLYDACILIETKSGLTGSSSRAPMNSQNASRYAHLLCSVIANDCSNERQSERCKKSLRDYGVQD
jgi:hypothetical protein